MRKIPYLILSILVFNACTKSRYHEHARPFPPFKSTAAIEESVIFDCVVKVADADAPKGLDMRVISKNTNEQGKACVTFEITGKPKTMSCLDKTDPGYIQLQDIYTGIGDCSILPPDEPDADEDSPEPASTPQTAP